MWHDVIRLLEKLFDVVAPLVALPWTPILVAVVMVGVVVVQLRRPDRDLGPAITLIIVTGVLVVVFVGMASAVLDVLYIFRGSHHAVEELPRDNLVARGLWYSLRTAATAFAAAASLSAFGGIAVFVLRRIRPAPTTSVTTRGNAGGVN